MAQNLPMLQNQAAGNSNATTLDVDSQLASIGTNTSRAVQNLLEGTQKLNYYFFGLAYIKLVVSAYILSITGCEKGGPMAVWTIMMMLYDMMVIINRTLARYSSNNTQRNSEQSSQVPNQEGYTLAPVSQSASTDSIDEELNNRAGDADEEYSAMERFSGKKIREIIQKYDPLFYTLVFLIGNFVLMTVTPTDVARAPYLYRLMTIYLVFQYINMSMPFLLCCSIICICFTALCCGVMQIYKAHTQAQLEKNIIDELPSRKYPLQLSGDHECSICISEYENDNDIVELECSKMHHFHSECIKKWLKVNGVCPICRVKLVDMKRNKKH